SADPGVLSSVFGAITSWWHGVVADDVSSVRSEEFFDVMAQMEGFETELGVIGPGGDDDGGDGGGNGNCGLTSGGASDAGMGQREQRYSFRPRSWRRLTTLHAPHASGSGRGGGGDSAEDHNAVPVGTVAPGVRVLGDRAAAA
ncbi:unnamed protein product, partial [Phaeothamnion confervicola]